MTIAACYLSSEGVVFGADSTSTIFVPGPGGAGIQHHYNFAQKIFQIGEHSSLGIAMWGLGNLFQVSYRTLIARFADSLTTRLSHSPQELAESWADFFWSEYSATPVYQRVQGLLQQQSRTQDEEAELQSLLQSFSGGFCLGGCLEGDRVPFAFEILYSPGNLSCGPQRSLGIGSTSFWGCPNLIERLIYGIDGNLFESILNSGRWSGTAQELADIVIPHRLTQPFDLPIREAIDWVHTSIYTTNRAMKFSHLPPVCGGPVEVAVITTDRPFRWVRHKRLDAAIGSDGQLDGQ